MRSQGATRLSGAEMGAKLSGSSDADRLVVGRASGGLYAGVGSTLGRENARQNLGHQTTSFVILGEVPIRKDECLAFGCFKGMEGGRHTRLCSALRISPSRLVGCEGV